MLGSIAIAFLLAATTPAAATTPDTPPPAAKARKNSEMAEKSADPRDKIICKRFLETGSLVKGYRTCQTKAEWDRQRENVRTLSTSTSCSATGNGGSCQ